MKGKGLGRIAFFMGLLMAILFFSYWKKNQDHCAHEKCPSDGSVAELGEQGGKPGASEEKNTSETADGHSLPGAKGKDSDSQHASMVPGKFDVPAGQEGPGGPTGLNGKEKSDGKTTTLTHASKPAPRVCKRVEFRHREMASHEDGEACLRHSNRIAAPKEGFMPETACVRVNGRAVRHRWSAKSREIEFPAGPGPLARVQVEFCDSGKAPPAPCVVRKNGVLEGFGVGESFEGSPSAGWAGEGKAELKKEVAEFRKIAAEIEGVDANAVFRGWEAKNIEEMGK